MARLGDTISLLALVLAAIALYYSSLKRPDVRVIAYRYAGSEAFGMVEDLGDGRAAVRLIVSVVLSNVGARGGVLLDVDPHLHPVLGTAVVERRQELKIFDADDEGRSFAAPVVVGASAAVLRKFVVDATVAAPEPVEAVLEGGPGDDPPTTEIRFSYAAMGGVHLRPWRRGQPIVKVRSLDVEVPLLRVVHSHEDEDEDD